MKISIIVPIYNVEKYIAKCLRSLKKQTLGDFECLLINDGTPDKSVEIAKAEVGNDTRFRFFDKANGGLSDARNYGLGIAQGEYVCFIDSDDYLDERLLELAYSSAEKHQSDIVCFDMYYAYEDGRLELSKGADFGDCSSYAENPGIIFINNSANNKLFRLSFLKDKTFIKGMWYEDLAVIPVWLAQAGAVSYVAQPLYYYVQHSGSITHKADPRIFDIYRALKLIKEKLQLEAKDLNDLYLDNGLVMTTLRIKDFSDRKTRLAYYRENIRHLNTDYPAWYAAALKRQGSLKQKLIFSLLKLQCFALVDGIYQK